VIAAIVLAAGLARRMGRPKLLLDLTGKPVLRWSVEAVAPHVDDLIVVTGPEAARVQEILHDLPVRFAVNPRPEDGQGASIAAGAAALAPATRAVLVALGDQPRLPSTVIPSLLATFAQRGAAIVAPVYRGVQGTPVLFAAETFPELAGLTGDAGARTLVRAHPERVALVELDHPMPVDVDTPEDLAKLHVK
jgi:molybdenum cofactor cytidylyltransferase